VEAAVRIENRFSGIGAEGEGSALMSAPREGHQLGIEITEGGRLGERALEL